MQEVGGSRGRSLVRSWWLKFAFPTFLPARALGSILERALDGCDGGSQDGLGNESKGDEARDKSKQSSSL